MSPTMGYFFCAGDSMPHRLPTRTLFELGWHFGLILVGLLHGFCLGDIASGQICPGGQCPISQYPHPVAAAPAIQQTPTADYQCAVVRVGREDLSSPGASYSGAGTFVAHAADRRGLVLTASHVVDQGGGRIWVDFGRGRQTASLLGRDANLDLAALVVDNPPSDIRAIAVAGEDQWPHAGESVEVIGFGGGRLRHFSALVRGYTAKDVRGVSQLVVAFQPISGDSGGAILYKQKLVGVLWGGPCEGPQQNAYETHATCCIYIRRFLDGIGVHLNPPRPPAGKPPGAAEPFVGPPPAVPPQAEPPAVPQTPQSVNSERLAAIEKRLEELAAQVSSVSAGPAGAPGARGPQGLPGPAGPAGKDADPADLAAIAGRLSAIEKNLKGKLHFSLQVDSQTGKILSTSSGSQ